MTPFYRSLTKKDTAAPPKRTAAQPSASSASVKRATVTHTASATRAASAQGNDDNRFGYRDDRSKKPFRWRVVPLVFCILFLTSCWLFLDQKILFGDSWLSPTYDNVNWRTNEGNAQTYGAWDLETHIWKSEFIMQNWPNVLWNPYWYLGMPPLKYYQVGFYAIHISVAELFHLDLARAANLIIIFGHLAAIIATFILCLRISRKYFLSMLCAFFVIANTFISLRSYGWEPITVVFLWLYPLTLLLFLRQPLRPLRFWMVIALTFSYFMHPLIWFSLCMSIGIYLLTMSVAVARQPSESIARHSVLTQYVVLVLLSLLLGGFQSIPQFTYSQVTSGAHMGLQYLPFYQVPPNVISLREFFFDYTNLKGPGPIVMLAFLFLIVFGAAYIIARRKERAAYKRSGANAQHDLREPPNAMLLGFGVLVLIMVLFYYLEGLNLFPMNIIRSIQYHRIIPEFIVASAALIAATSALLSSQKARIFYYGTLISFVLGGMLVISGIQAHWETAPSISGQPEFITEAIPGRISMTYPDQSLSVRSSFTYHPQAYGYYEQGITNSYADEIFSVSSGFHNANLTILYLRAADVTRLYVNREGSERSSAVHAHLDGQLLYTDQNERYGYFTIPILNPDFAQAVPLSTANQVLALKPGCREIFKDTYCESVHEEFVSTDYAEQRYLTAYVNMLETPYGPRTTFTMLDPDHYTIAVSGAQPGTAVVIKMTGDRSWRASVDGTDLPIQSIGPDFMIVQPSRAGDYTIQLTYTLNTEYIIGGTLTVITLIGISVYFYRRRTRPSAGPPEFGPGNMDDDVRGDRR